MYFVKTDDSCFKCNIFSRLKMIPSDHSYIDLVIIAPLVAIVIVAVTDQVNRFMNADRDRVIQSKSAKVN